MFAAGSFGGWFGDLVYNVFNAGWLLGLRIRNVIMFIFCRVLFLGWLVKTWAPMAASIN